MQRSLLAVVLLLAFAFIACEANAPQGFIRAHNERFVDRDCKEFNFVGTNAWRMVQMAAGKYPFGDGSSGWPTTKAGLGFLIRPEAPKKGPMNPALWAIRQMQTSNLTVLRVFGTGADPSFPFVVEPGTAGADGKTWPNGKYNWDFVFGLEQIVEWCRAHGVKVMFTILDNWSPVDSKTKFVEFANELAGKSLNVDDFWSDPLVKSYYKNHMSFLLNHPNKLANNLQFKDDPTIIGWNLFNEPRCNCNPSIIDPSTGRITDEPEESNCGNIVKCTADMTAWVKEMAAFAKKIAPKQLLGLGDEGFATYINNQDSAALVASNPGNWAATFGDSVSLQAINGIDYFSTHLWVDNWGVAVVDSGSDASVAMSAPKADGSSFAFDREWLRTRKAAAAASGSPFVIEEFGKFVPRPVEENDRDIELIRDPWFEEVFDQTQKSIDAGEPLRAIMIWKYAVTPLNNATDKNWITADDTTWTDIIRPYARKIYNIRPKVANCKPGAMISSVTVAPAAAAATVAKAAAKAAERPVARNLRDGEVQYVTRGNHLLATQAGKSIGEAIADVEGPWVCAAACQLQPLCTGFNYNKQLSRCTLQQDAGGEVAFDADGWQSFWHEDHFQDWEHAEPRSVAESVRSFIRPWL